MHAKVGGQMFTTVPDHVVSVRQDEQGRTVTTFVADFHQYFEDAQFYAIARNALDVKQRRGWYARLNRYDRYLVYNRDGEWVADLQWMEEQNWTDDLIAIVEASKHVEKSP